MKRFAVPILLLAVFFSLTTAASAREFFVSKQGDDIHDGLSMGQAFATIQKGVDALSPGDTLTIVADPHAEIVLESLFKVRAVPNSSTPTLPAL